MEYFATSISAGCLIVFSVLLFIVLRGRRALLPALQNGGTSRRGDLPAVSVFIPVSSVSPQVEEALRTILHQDYPRYEIIFITERNDGPDAAEIRKLLKEQRSGKVSCRHVVSGPAVTCSQKNHNLLAGVAAASPASAIFAFCDSTHPARPDWLRHLAAGLSKTDSCVATGYHLARPGDRRLATIGRSLTILMMHFAQTIPFVTQPWGGNMAIGRKLFYELDVPEIWSTSVVDDVTLAARLQKSGMAVRFVPEAFLATPLADETYERWISWLSRQFLYIKYIFPLGWIGTGVVLLVSLLCLAGAWIVIASAAAGGLPVKFAVVPMLFLLIIGVPFLLMRPFVSAKTVWPVWLVICLITFGVVVWSHFRTLFIGKISWAGRSYRVAVGGKVRGITLED